MNCCICGNQVSAQDAKRFQVIIEGDRIATCCADHQLQARAQPASCRINGSTALELTPL